MRLAIANKAERTKCDFALALMDATDVVTSPNQSRAQDSSGSNAQRGGLGNRNTSSQTQLQARIVHLVDRFECLEVSEIDELVAIQIILCSRWHGFEPISGRR